MHFSKPFATQTTKNTPNSPKAPQLPAKMSQLSVEDLAPVRGRRLPVNDSSFQAQPGTASTVQTLLQHHLDFEFPSFSWDSDSNVEPGSEYQGYHTRSSSKASNSIVQQLPPPKPRYYSHALTAEDKDALARGEKNHNLRVYTPKDVVMHHESRKALVPQGTGTDKLRKMETLATIEQDKQLSQRALDKKASQSMCDLRSSSAPAPKDHFQAPVSPPLPTLARKFSFDMSSPPASHARATSTGDYFSHRPYQPSPSSSGSSSRARSPLSNTSSIHRHNPSTTFDAFLAPHKTGKGEAYRGAANAKMPKVSQSSTPNHSLSPAKEKSPRRRFSRMPSIPSLKKRMSRRNLGKDGVDGEQDVPPLP
ncbi:hypothetical protein BDU57DRAFT_256557 [Ampelomyces quisqualis]|uniref:Pal1 cell morphology protein-domain-containing protein n=1 Tax=Ampelomyces quisqualis TaxID=50730 RepID=A0A6A5QQP4_AMPQU|nr:hypothetical protein BDU57DRAFT_256557 [Ampelomyces quisqualis]